MKNIRVFSILLFVIVPIISCTKENDGFDYSKWNAISAGDYGEAITTQLNDTIDATYYLYPSSIVYDLNKDEIPDLEIMSIYSTFFQQSKFTYESRIKTHNTCDIIIDTTIKVIKKRTDTIPGSSVTAYFNQKVPIPEPLNEDAIINSNRIWSQDNNWMFFAFYRDQVIDGEAPIYVFENKEYNGWLDPENAYLGYRIRMENDTLYGFIKIKIEGHSRICIENTALR